MRDDLIVYDSRVLGGKPCVRGTRLSIQFLLELAASGATRDEILVRYPQLAPEVVAAAFRYAADVLKGEPIYLFFRRSASRSINHLKRSGAT